MSKSAVVSFLKCNGRSMIASVRIASFIAETLGLDLIDTEEKCLAALHRQEFRYETLIVVNGPSAFLPWVELLGELCRAISTKRIVWVMNDYTIYPPTQMRKVLNERKDLEFEVWGTLPVFPPKWQGLAIWTRFPKEANAYINFNSLTYAPLPLVEPTKDGLMYYGAFRDGRKDEFVKYFSTKKYHVHISTSQRAVEKFETECFDHTDTQFTFFPKWDSFADLQDYKATLYIHDKFSTQYFCSPANRFYECLSAGVAMFFDESCVKTMEQDTFKFDVRPYVVKNADDVQEKLLYWKRIRNDQRANWCHDFIGDLKAVVTQVGADFNI